MNLTNEQHADLKEVVLAELAKGTHTEAFADGTRWVLQEAAKLAARPTESVLDAPTKYIRQEQQRAVTRMLEEQRGQRLPGPHDGDWLDDKPYP